MTKQEKIQVIKDEIKTLEKDKTAILINMYDLKKTMDTLENKYRKLQKELKELR